MAKIESKVFVGPNAVFTNDKIPRAKLFRQEYERTVGREGASVGANATLLPRIEVGEYALIGAGSTVTGDVPPYAVVYGVPARIRKYVCKCGKLLRFRNGSRSIHHETWEAFGREETYDRSSSSPSRDCSLQKCCSRWEHRFPSSREQPAKDDRIHNRVLVSV